MNNQSKVLIGAWIQAIGTIISAIANIPIRTNEQEQSTSLDLWGNVLQGTGNALLADSEVGFSLDKVGNKVQAIGNIVNVFGLLANISEEMESKLNIKGNLIQAAGGSLSFADGLNEEFTPASFYENYGNLLQIIGNSMQSIAENKELKTGDGEILNTIGGWIQAIGSVLSLISALKKS